MEKQIDTKSAMLEGGSRMSESSWDAEGGNDSEVAASETRDQFYENNDGKKLGGTIRETEGIQQMTTMAGSNLNFTKENTLTSPGGLKRNVNTP
jgi:hypothetical protein